MRSGEFINKFFISQFQPGDGLSYWRERIFNGIILAFFIFGTIAIIPNLIASLMAKFISIFIIDAFIYITLLFIVFTKKINLTFKMYYLFFAIYMLGIFLLVKMGPYGPGLIWIVSGSVFIALMLDIQKTLFSIAFNFLIILTLAVLIHFKISDTPFFSAYKVFDWIAIGLNVVVISAVCSIPISILIQGLEKTLNEERELKLELIEKNQLISEEMILTKEADKFKSSFLANLSHEIRTPMNAIVGFSELIAMEENLPPKIKKYSDQIFTNSDFLLNIINDIVDISLIEAGQIKIRKEFFSINQLMKELSNIVDSMILRKKRPDLLISFSNDSGMHDEVIFFDKNHLKQIIINFITNAIKYTPSGSIKIGCTLFNNELIFYVKDTGSGIPEKEKENIFNRFTRINHEKNLLIPGMGIGLSIVKGLSDAIGGKVWLESEEKKEVASIFHFHFTWLNPECY